MVCYDAITATYDLEEQNRKVEVIATIFLPLLSWNIGQLQNIHCPNDNESFPGL